MSRSTRQQNRFIRIAGREVPIDIDGAGRVHVAIPDAPPCSECGAPTNDDANPMRRCDDNLLVVRCSGCGWPYYIQATVKPAG